MRIAVDVCISKVGVRVLQDAGHHVVAIAQQAESDREWFNRALRRDVELVLAIDADIEILCYDHNIHFFGARRSERGLQTVQRFLTWHSRNWRKLRKT